MRAFWQPSEDEHAEATACRLEASLTHVVAPALACIVQALTALKAQNPEAAACRLEASVTHVVAPALARNARILAAMAAGLWVVSWDLLQTSQRNRHLLEPVCPDPDAGPCAVADYLMH